MSIPFRKKRGAQKKTGSFSDYDGVRCLNSIVTMYKHSLFLSISAPLAHPLSLGACFYFFSLSLFIYLTFLQVLLLVIIVERIFRQPSEECCSLLVCLFVHVLERV